MKIKAIPETDRPREKAWSHGVNTLNDAELLAIIIRTGTNNYSALELSYLILDQFKGIEGLSRTDIHELASIRGISKIKAVELLAALELAKRLSDKPRIRQKIETPSDVYDLLGERQKNATNEEFFLVFLDSKKYLIAYVCLTKGNINTTIIHPRDILREAIRFNAHSIICVHNHPTGDPKPSKNDVETTEALCKAAMLMGIPIVDHVILGFDCFYSFKLGNLL